jgi:hypothetical protein
MTSYKGAKGCKKGSISKEEALTRAEILAQEVFLRGRYLSYRCDYFLAGSIARGSALAEAGHREQYAGKLESLTTCLEKAAGIK